MKNLFLTVCLIITPMLSVAQVKQLTPKEIEQKVLDGYEAVLSSQDLKDCRSQNSFKRFFTNSCTDFINTSERAIIQMTVSVDRYKDNYFSVGDSMDDFYLSVLSGNLHFAKALVTQARSTDILVGAQAGANELAQSISERKTTLKGFFEK